MHGKTLFTPALIGLLCLALTACWEVSLSEVRNTEDGRGKSYVVSTPLRANGDRRNYRLHVPKNWDGESRLPVVLVLHGAFMTAKQAEESFGFTELSDKEGFLAVYPNAMGLYSLFQHWNAGYCCGKAQADRVDDAWFLDWCLGDVATAFPIDPDRVYMAGFSNGGMLAYHYATHQPRRFAAMAVVASALPEDDTLYTPPDSAIPLAVIHGRTDANIPYAGGMFKNDPESSLPSFRSTRQTVREWVERNGCTSSPEKTVLYGGRVVRESWNGCPDARRVTLYTIEDFGHRWPSGKFVQDIPMEMGRRLNGAELIWEFFQEVTPRFSAEYARH